MNTPQTFKAAVAAALALALALAACGGDSNEGGTDSAPAGSTATTVSVESIDGVGDVLVDSDGAALYTADQERDGKVRCTAACAEIWLPLTLPAGGPPSGPEEVAGELGVAERPDGERQPTFDGKLLYRFADDGMAGQVTGDGLSDTFDGRLFTWRVVTTNDGADQNEREPGVGPYG